MVDEWGRLTFNDGAALAQGLRVIQADNERRQDRSAQREAFSVVDAMDKDEDISGYSPQARYNGAKLKFERDINSLDKQIKEHMVSDAGRKSKMAELDAINKKASHLFQQYQAARRSGDEMGAKKIAHQFNNEVAYNGVYIPETEPGTGKLSIVRQMTGETETIDDLPIEQYDNLISGYMNIPQDQMAKQMLSGEQVRMQHNFDIISKAEPWINDSGKVIYKIPAGTWDKKDSKVKGAFFVDSLASMGEISKDNLKGFRPMRDEESRRKATKKEPVNPDYVVTGKGPGGNQKQGLIVQGSRGPEFQDISGTPAQGLDTAGQPDPTKAKAAYELSVKQLNTQLMPFNKTESPIFEKDPQGNYRLTEGGHNALMAAMKLVERADVDQSNLSPSESKLVPYARQAITMYQSMSQKNAQDFNLSAVQSNQPSRPAPPPGFVRMNQ